MTCPSAVSSRWPGLLAELTTRLAAPVVEARLARLESRPPTVQLGADAGLLNRPD